METRRRKQNVTRYCPPGVIPLEIWDLWVGERTLWERMQEPSFPQILVRCLVELRRGEGATRSEGPVPRRVAGFDSLFVSGGRAKETTVRAALSNLGLPVVYSATPDFPARVQADALLRDRRAAAGWVVDLGQTSLKISSRDAERVFARDFTSLPVRTGNGTEQIAQQRSVLRDWVAQSLRAFSRDSAPPEGVFFSLPSRLDAAGVPEGSSYIGMAGDAELVADTLDRAGLEPRVVLTGNDAELASLEALAEPDLRARDKTLVLTLGFGVGATLVCWSEVRNG